MDTTATEARLKRMQMHESFTIEREKDEYVMTVTRVPGGLLYTSIARYSKNEYTSQAGRQVAASIAIATNIVPFVFDI